MEFNVTEKPIIQHIVYTLKCFSLIKVCGEVMLFLKEFHTKFSHINTFLRTMRILAYLCKILNVTAFMIIHDVIRVKGST